MAVIVLPQPWYIDLSNKTTTTSKNENRNRTTDAISASFLFIIFWISHLIRVLIMWVRVLLFFLLICFPLFSLNFIRARDATNALHDYNRTTIKSDPHWKKFAEKLERVNRFRSNYFYRFVFLSSFHSNGLTANWVASHSSRLRSAAWR